MCILDCFVTVKRVVSGQRSAVHSRMVSFLRKIRMCGVTRVRWVCVAGSILAAMPIAQSQTERAETRVTEGLSAQGGAHFCFGQHNVGAFSLWVDNIGIFGC
jgi:hypothetical protein